MAPHFNESTPSEPTTSENGALCQIITPIGMLGYGFSDAETDNALRRAVNEHPGLPVALVLDSGSTDSGPSKLALGSMTCPRTSYVQDLRRLIRLGQKYKVPLLFSSAGGDGSDEHVDVMLQIIDELAAEPGHEFWKLKVLAIYSGISKDIISKRLEHGKVTGCGPAVPKLEQDVLDSTPRVVAQMGSEPFLQAMIANPDFNIVIGGRAYDPVPYISYCAFHYTKKSGDGTLTKMDPFQLGAFTHMGKILECGGLCATPKSKGAIATVYKDRSFEVRPSDPKAKCTPLSVAAHTFYEKTRPDILTGPGGSLDLTKSTYKQCPDGVSVLVKGSEFKHVAAQGKPYDVKLEGARVRGYRTLIMGSFCDPILMPQVESFLEGIKENLIQVQPDIADGWDLTWHITRGEQQVFVVGEALAASQADATSLASLARIYCIHAPYPGQKATSGNFGMGIGGNLELPQGQCAEFSVYHLLELRPGEEGVQSDSNPSGLFKLAVREIGLGQKAPNGSAVTEEPVANGKTSTPAPPQPSKAAPASKSSEAPRTLMDAAKVVRSKNAGPYEITLDVMFDTTATYELFKASGLLNSAVIADLFGLREDEIIWCGFFDAGLGFKATIPRLRDGKPSCSGGFMENDVHGSQKYVPLASLVLPDTLISQLA